MNLYTDRLLSLEECRALIDAFERHVGESNERDFSGQPVVRWPFGSESSEVAAVVEKCHLAVVEMTSLNLARTAVETTILTRMSPGGWHEAHADNVRRDDQGNWVPNHTPNRTYTAIVYLSTPIDGGELYFPQHGVKVRPSAGQLVLFAADGDHEHGVTPVRAGLRYSLAMWLTWPDLRPVETSVDAPG